MSKIQNAMGPVILVVVMVGELLVIDGSHGEGGGQILRTSLALSMVTGRPFRIDAIRAKRGRPGLLRQHLTAVIAAARIANAEAEGAKLGSTSVTFHPARVQPGKYTFNVGSAGSAMLVLQTVLPPLLSQPGESLLTLEGGTHNPAAPPFDFLDKVFLPILRKMGADVDAKISSHGFYPAGGGKFTVSIQSKGTLKPLTLLDRGPVLEKKLTALVAKLPPDVGEREVRRVSANSDLAQRDCRVKLIEDSPGPGNALMLEVVSEEITEMFTAFGERGVRAESVADRLLEEYQRYIAAGVPVGEHLADQLLLPLALAGSGGFDTLPLTMHAKTQLGLVPRFLDVPLHVVTIGPNRERVILG
ncbi:MAG: RNA 3'-terminal phosphate cyclase [Planctomycetota bacterium]